MSWFTRYPSWDPRKKKAQKPVVIVNQNLVNNKVDSVNWKTGHVRLDTNDIPDTVDHRYVTDAEQDVIQSTSGTNTGDETTATILTKIGDGASVWATYLPSYVDDVLEFSTYWDLPVIWEIWKIYVVLTWVEANKIYRWSWSAYIEISSWSWWAVRWWIIGNISDQTDLWDLAVLDTVWSSQIDNWAITNSKLWVNSVTWSKIANGTITHNNLWVFIVQWDNIALGAVDTTSLADWAVTIAKTTWIQPILAEWAFVDGDKTKLDDIESGAQVNTVTPANNVTLVNKTLTSPVINTPTGIVKWDVGLWNVDNTSDVNKPVSIATETALNMKEDTANKSLSVTTDQASNTKFPSVKSVYDWAIGLFVKLTDTIAINRWGTWATTASGALTALWGAKLVGGNVYDWEQTIYGWIVVWWPLNDWANQYLNWWWDWSWWQLKFRSKNNAWWYNPLAMTLNDLGDLNVTRSLTANWNITAWWTIWTFADTRRILFSGDKRMAEDSSDGEILEIRQNTGQWKPWFKITDQSGTNRYSYEMRQNKVSCGDASLIISRIVWAWNPEGSVTANPWSTFQSSDGLLYRKRSWTGSTWWTSYVGRQSKTITIESPTAWDNITMFYTTQPINLLNKNCCVANWSTQFDVLYGSNRTSWTTLLNNVVCNHTAWVNRTWSEAIPANSWVWINIDSSTSDRFTLNLDFH